MKLTKEQQRVVEENMGLVSKVIQDKVHGTSQSGTYAYEDLFQIGCIGLCKAAATDKGGCFSTYAYRLIWNEICDELIRSTRRALKEQTTDTIELRSSGQSSVQDQLATADIRYALAQAKESATGATAKGIACLELSIHGYNSQEIGKIMKAEAATVRMWMTKARRYLKEFPDLQAFNTSEAAV